MQFVINELQNARHEPRGAVIEALDMAGFRDFQLRLQYLRAHEEANLAQQLEADALLPENEGGVVLDGYDVDFVPGTRAAIAAAWASPFTTKSDVVQMAFNEPRILTRAQWGRTFFFKWRDNLNLSAKGRRYGVCPGLTKRMSRARGRIPFVVGQCYGRLEQEGQQRCQAKIAMFGDSCWAELLGPGQTTHDCCLSDKSAAILDVGAATFEDDLSIAINWSLNLNYDANALAYCRDCVANMG